MFASGCFAFLQLAEKMTVELVIKPAVRKRADMEDISNKSMNAQTCLRSVCKLSGKPHKRSAPLVKGVVHRKNPPCWFQLSHSGTSISRPMNLG